MLTNPSAVPLHFKSRPWAGLLVLFLAVSGAGLARADEDGFVPVPETRVTSQRVTQYFLRRPGPARDGKPTRPIRWAIGASKVANPSANLPQSDLDWTSVKAVRFWLYMDKARDTTLTVVLTGKTSAYFKAQVPINFSGWKQITVPIESFEGVHSPTLAGVRSIGWRGQDFGQPAVEAGAVWWIDGVSVQLKPQLSAAPARFNAAVRQAQGGLSNWDAAGSNVNPILSAADELYAAQQPAFQAQPVNDLWNYRDQAEALIPLAYAVADPRSPAHGRADLVQNFTARVDAILAGNNSGTWWPTGAKSPDPNLNRFVLLPLIDSVMQFKQLPDGAAAWARWQGPLRAAVDFQKKDYGPSNPFHGNYVNQDVYYALIMAISSKLWNRDDENQLARNMIKDVHDNLLPDGGFHYIGQENESPLYHTLNLLILGRYLTLTGDPVARDTIESTVNYWPLTLSKQGQPEYWSDVWFKQGWFDVEREALMVSATVTGDPRNKYLLNQVLKRTSAPVATMHSLYAAPYWRSPNQGNQQALPNRFVLPDRNIRGAHGREDDFYFGVTRGRGLRNTFAGAMISTDGDQPLDSALRFAGFDIITNPSAPHGLWLSQVNDDTALAVKSGVAAGLGVTFSPQPSIISSPPLPPTPDNGWKVTQVWRAAGEGLLGQLILESTRPMPAQSVVARIGLGPAPLQQQPDGSWLCGSLHIVALQSFGNPVATTAAAYSQDSAIAWPAIEWRQPVAGATVPAGQHYALTLWIGPNSAKPPVAWKAMPNNSGWVARRDGGGNYGVLYNSGSNPLTMRIPVSGSLNVTRAERVGERLNGRPGGPSITLEPNSVVLIETAE